MSSPDSNTVSMYVFFVFSCLFFLLAIYVHSQDKFPFAQEDLKNPEGYFKGLMVTSSICTFISIGFALKKKDKIKTKDALLVTSGFCAVLAGIIVAWQSETSLIVLGLTSLSGLISAASLDTQ